MGLIPVLYKKTVKTDILLRQCTNKQFISNLVDRRANIYSILIYQKGDLNQISIT
jgi:hypothetical protein